MDNLVAGEQAVFTLVGGVPGSGGITVCGPLPGQTPVNNFAGYCATFDIHGVNLNRIVGDQNRLFDGNGEMTFSVNIPGHVSGYDVLFQSAMRGTCPDECMSNLVMEVIQ